MTRELREEFEHYLESLSSIEEPFFLPEYYADYEIISCLQDNPQKKTFLLQNKNGRKILCKYACGDFRVMLKTEYELGIGEHFPFLPYIIDYRETDDGAILLREYIEGKTLREIVGEEGPLSLADALAVIQKVCLALTRLHNATPALIHRDIKPSNIILTDSGDCYLVDMGTARRYQSGNSSDTFCMGTTNYAAPEQFGARQTDVRTDIYGLGLLFYFLLTGKSNIQDDSLDKLPRLVVDFIRKCTAFNPDDRYENIRQIQKVLNRLEHAQKHSRICIVLCTLTILAVALPLALIVSLRHFGNRKVVFSSSLLEQAVRQELGKTDGETVYQEDLLAITSLEICGTTVLNARVDHFIYSPDHMTDGKSAINGGISDLSLLAHMTNLSNLTLDYQNITDLTPLKGLPLISLSLAGNPLCDLTALSDCKRLCKLDISATQVLTLDPLAECKNLQELRCVYTPVRSLEPLADSGLVHLYIWGTILSEYEPLETLQLTILECSNIPLSAMQSIKKISTLQELTIYNSAFPTLEDFSGFENLFHLSLDFDAVQSLDGIDSIPTLNMLSIASNPISECPPLPTLRYLRIENTGIRDFTFLREMPALTELIISEAQRPGLMEDIPEPWFQIFCY